MIRSAKNKYHLLRALAANTIYRFPAKKLKIIGITGTDGKTTTTALIYHILKESGKKVSMISSVYAKVGPQEYDIGFHVTSPDPFATQKFLQMSLNAGDEFFVLETTSHALDQNRVWGVEFEVGIITNITHEHLDYHKTYENYVRTKARLLKKSRNVLINQDDQSYEILKSIVDQCTNIPTPHFYTYGLNSNANFHENMEDRIGTPLADFNKYNYLAAFATCKLLGLHDEEIIKALKTFKLPPGRVDIITRDPYMAIIDFAHTPNALEEILRYVRRVYVKNGGRLIHVFGSAALRDQSKRPFMGEASGRYADLTILTEEDYRTEDPQKICSEIAIGLEKKGFKKTESLAFGETNKSYTVIINREQAINKAVSIAKVGDVLIFTGKGHEKSLCRGKTEYPWDEKKTVMNAIAQQQKED